jgi:acyl-CoA dehydrogenase
MGKAVFEALKIGLRMAAMSWPTPNPVWPQFTMVSAWSFIAATRLNVGLLQRGDCLIDWTMAIPTDFGSAPNDERLPRVGGRDVLYPLTFSTKHPSNAVGAYLNEPSLRKLLEFFENKGLQAIKDEDQKQQWYEDWIAYQSTHNLYASLLSPKMYSTCGRELDLLRLTRFLELFAYLSPAHGYSLQVTFLGLFAILMGSNEPLKREAVAALEKGALYAFAASEKNHGSDLLANEFEVANIGPGRLIARGSKYYIGNANCASIISILARKTDDRPMNHSRRAVPVLFALRPRQSKGFGSLRKISTLGIRSAFVGEFEVKDHEFPASDIIAEGRKAWDAVLGTVALGKFFLGFGSIGICERALEEAIGHLTHRVLYGKPVIEMPHIGSAVAQAYARLTAMKLYAFRALDYVQAAGADERRYLLYCAVQKARVSTEGVKVISLLSECIGAKGFESDTYFEMALRDIQLIPSLEGSVHINLVLTAQFIPQYFNRTQFNQPIPDSSTGHYRLAENAYLMEAHSSQINMINFPNYLDGYWPLKSVPNVRIFARQAKAFRRLARSQSFQDREAGTLMAIALGHCMATIAYGQLVAENCARFDMPQHMVSTMFYLLINDLNNSALTLASSSDPSDTSRILIERMVVIPRSTNADWNFVLEHARMPGLEQARQK